MSREATAWAWAYPVEDATERLILLSLGDLADPWGYGAYPHLDRLAADAVTSERGVQRHLRTMEERGVLERTAGATTRKPPTYRIVAMDPARAHDPEGPAEPVAAPRPRTAKPSTQQRLIASETRESPGRVRAPRAPDQSGRDSVTAESPRAKAAHRLTVLAFSDEAPHKPLVSTKPGTKPFVIVMARIEEALEARYSVQELERVIKAGVGSWTRDALSCALSRERTREEREREQRRRARGGTRSGDQADRFMEGVRERWAGGQQ